jgi:hypothetical protein
MIKYLIIVLNEYSQNFILIRTNGINGLCFIYYVMINYYKPYKVKVNLKIESIVMKSIITT